MIHDTSLFRCYFGNQSDVLNPKEYLALSNVQDILTLEPFSKIKALMSINRLIFLRQTHSTRGIAIIDAQSSYNQTSFSQNGDYLISNQPHVGIGVMTADCLPLIVVDRVNKAIGIAHAGWRGAVASIGPIMLAHMHTAFGTQPDHIQIFFGPHANACCYEVDQPFIQQIAHIPQYEQCVISRDDRLYFDNIQCNLQLLTASGVPQSAFCYTYNACTICNPTYYSHRRGHTKRQMTIVSLV